MNSCLKCMNRKRVVGDLGVWFGLKIIMKRLRHSRTFKKLCEELDFLLLIIVCLLAADDLQPVQATLQNTAALFFFFHSWAFVRETMRSYFPPQTKLKMLCGNPWLWKGQIADANVRNMKSQAILFTRCKGFWTRAPAPVVETNETF